MHTPTRKQSVKHCLTLSCGTLVGHSCRKHSCGTLLWDVPAGHSCWHSLVGHSCDTLVAQSCGTLVQLAQSCGRVLWDILVGHSCGTPLLPPKTTRRVKSPNPALRARLPPKPTCQVSKMSASCKISSKTHARIKFCRRLPPQIARQLSRTSVCKTLPPKARNLIRANTSTCQAALC